MQKQKSARIVAVVLLSVLALSFAAYAVLRYTETITNTAQIKGYEVCLWRTDTDQRVTSIAWGGLDQGTTKTTEQVFAFSQKLVVKQVGEYLGPETWHLNSTLPNGVTLTAQYYVAGAWNEWTQDVAPPVNLNNVPVKWTLSIAIDALRVGFDFDILLQTGT